VLRADHPAPRANRPVARQPPTARGERVYGQTTKRRLTFIKGCRRFGFSIEQVRELAGSVDQPDRLCSRTGEVADKQGGSPAAHSNNRPLVQ
jgi:DNA-binding transcriptional MerR regulator